MKKIFYLFLIIFFVGSVAVAPVSAKTVTTKKTIAKTQVAKKSATTKKSKITTKKVKGKKIVVSNGKDSSDYVPPTRFSAEAAAAKPAFNGAKQPPDGYMEAVNTALNDYLKAKKAAHGNKEKLQAAEDDYNSALETAGAMLAQ